MPGAQNAQEWAAGSTEETGAQTRGGLSSSTRLPLPHRPHLSEEGPVEGDSIETVHRAHVDVQIHEQTLLLL